ncbi:preprotein translocase subunit SecE [Brachyspira catarrhinii]|uniref:Preprotein translocase subunit SecE n=1 Tax=Brachyspira catarrhinii TaxID=2528966 RepID=A0ABY2TMB7_9SPIR|nr:preprotein translocase subunit SecE [Brachyspira catarrhinii]TKZ24278.1 preprotein translocase subunit SecE [Brachyspira catarrhinii]
MAEKKKNKLFNSLDEIKKELFERSVWPTRQEVINQTVIVIILLIITSAFLGAADYAVTFITRTLLDGSIISAIMSSAIALVLIAVFVALFVIYFAIRYVRKNRYNR